MKSRKGYIARLVEFLGIHPVVGDMWAFQVILEILLILVLILLFSLPAVIW